MLLVLPNKMFLLNVLSAAAPARSESLIDVFVGLVKISHWFAASPSVSPWSVPSPGCSPVDLLHRLSTTRGGRRGALIDSPKMSEVVAMAGQAYMKQLQAHPLRTKAITSGVLAGCSDAVAQKISGVSKLQLRRLLLIAVRYSSFLLRFRRSCFSWFE